MKQKAIPRSQALTDVIVEALQDKKGKNIVRMDLRNLKGAIADYFVICTGTSDKHVQALADSVDDACRTKMLDKPMTIEGQSQGEWILMDYFDVIVHVFQRDKREFYSLEELWGDAVFEKFKD